MSNKDLEQRAAHLEQQNINLVTNLVCALDFIIASPCDPDITAGQRELYPKIQHLVERRMEQLKELGADF